MQCQESVSVLLVEDNPGEARLKEGAVVADHASDAREAVAS